MNINPWLLGVLLLVLVWVLVSSPGGGDKHDDHKGKGGDKHKRH